MESLRAPSRAQPGGRMSSRIGNVAPCPQKHRAIYPYHFFAGRAVHTREKGEVDLAGDIPPDDSEVAVVELHDVWRPGCARGLLVGRSPQSSNSPNFRHAAVLPRSEEH